MCEGICRQIQPRRACYRGGFSRHSHPTAASDPDITEGGGLWYVCARSIRDRERYHGGGVLMVGW